MDNMEKELWDAFYGKESKQEHCSVLTEAELNKHNKGMLKEGIMSDEDIHNQFSKFEVLDFSKEGEHSGYIELSFPNADEVDYDSSVITGYTIYEDGKVAFDNWFPDDVYNKVAEYVKQHHSEELDEGCGKKKAKKKLKEDYDENGNFKFSDAEIAQVGGRKGKSDKKYKIYQNGGGEIAITPHNLNGSWILMDDSNNFDEVFNTIQTDWEDANYILWDQELLNDSDVTSYYPFDSIEEEDYGTFVFDLSKYYVDDLDEGCGKKKKKALKEDMNASSPKMKKFGHFNVAVVFPNEKSVGRPRYTNTYRTEVEFYDDNNHEGFGPYGQFVSSYLLDTLLGKSEYSDNDGTYPYGLQLHGNSPNWTVPAETMSEIIDWLKQFDNETLKESVEPVYISVDVTRHNGSVIVKSDEFGKITYLPNDFEKLEDTIKRAVNDYAAENNIAEYEVIKLYESCGKKKALKESDEYVPEDEPTRVFFVKERNPWTEEDEITAVFPDEVNPTNGFVTCYAHIGQHSEGMLDAFLQCPEATEEEYASLLRELETVAKYDNLIVIDKPTEELDEGCGKKKKKSLKESDDLWSQIQNYKKKYGEPEIAQSGFDYYRYAKELYNGEPEEAIYGPGDIMKDLFNKASYLGDTLSTNEWNRIAEYVYGMCKERLPKVRIPNSLIAETSSEKNLKEVEDMSDIEAKLNKTIDAEMKKFPKYAADAKKALDDGDEIKKILNKYNQEYNFLYNNHDKVAGYEEAVRAWDEYINHPDFRELIGKVIKARHDMFTSDREIGALMFALDALGYLDKFDGKESSLEPVVKEFKMNEGITTIDVNGKRYDIDTSMFVVDKHKGKWCVLDTKSNVRYYMDSKKEAEQKCRELNDPEEWKKWYLMKESSLEPVVKEFKMNESEEKTNTPIVDLDGIVRKLKKTKNLTLSKRAKILEPYNLTPEQTKYVLDELHGVSRGHAYLYGPSEF